MEGFAEVTEELINEYLSFFGKNHVFSDAERTLLNRNWTQLVVKKNERVVTEGQKTLLWVEKGVLRIGKRIVGTRGWTVFAASPFHMILSVWIGFCRHRKWYGIYMRNRIPCFGD